MPRLVHNRSHCPFCNKLTHGFAHVFDTASNYHAQIECNTCGARSGIDCIRHGKPQRAILYAQKRFASVNERLPSEE